MNHFPIPEIAATLGTAIGVLEDRANGSVCMHLATDTTPASLVVEGELCLDELEATLIVAIDNARFGIRAKEYVEQNKIMPYMWGSSDENSGSVLSTEINPRYGISPAQAVAIRRELSSKELSMQGMSASKGGRVWLEACTSIVALEALIVELIDYCRRREYEPTYIDSAVNQEG